MVFFYSFHNVISIHKGIRIWENTSGKLMGTWFMYILLGSTYS